MNKIQRRVKKDYFESRQRLDAIRVTKFKYGDIFEHINDNLTELKRRQIRDELLYYSNEGLDNLARRKN